jgi:hypothetical protein
MAATMNANMVSVLDEVGVEHPRVRLNVRQNMATLYGSGAVVMRRTDVVSVTKPDRKHRLVTFADGATWSGEVKSGCGCR